MTLLSLSLSLSLPPLAQVLSSGQLGAGFGLGRGARGPPGVAARLLRSARAPIQAIAPFSQLVLVCFFDANQLANSGERFSFTFF